MWMCPRCEGLYEVNHQPHDCIDKVTGLKEVDESDRPVDGDGPSSFERELETLINMHSQENGSNTPDFILAAYLSDCLATWNRWVKRRDGWYGVKLRPGMSGNHPDRTPLETPSSGPNPDMPRVPYLREATPQLVRAVLEARGWQHIEDTGNGWWSIWESPAAPGRVMVPLRTDFNDFRQRMAEALRDIRLAHGEPEDERDAELLELRAKLSLLHP